MEKDKHTPPITTTESIPILQYSVPCDGVARGPGTKPVFIGIFSSFSRTGIIPQFFIANRWIYGRGTFKQKIAIKDPDLKKTITEIESEFTLKTETNSADLISGFVNVNLGISGVYWVEISLNGKLTMSYPLPVFEQQKQQ